MTALIAHHWPPAERPKGGVLQAARELVTLGSQIQGIPEPPQLQRCHHNHLPDPPERPHYGNIPVRIRFVGSIPGTALHGGLLLPAALPSLKWHWSLTPPILPTSIQSTGHRPRPRCGSHISGAREQAPSSSFTSRERPGLRHENPVANRRTGGLLPSKIKTGPKAVPGLAPSGPQLGAGLGDTIRVGTSAKAKPYTSRPESPEEPLYALFHASWSTLCCCASPRMCQPAYAWH
jgi:hypothetical protein